MKIPKSRLTLHGKPILRYMLDQLEWPGPTLLVTSPGLDRPVGYEAFGGEVLDTVPGEGPLRGLFTALEYATTELVVAMTVDMPGWEQEHLEWLCNQMEGMGVMCSRRSGGELIIEPFPCVLAREARTIVAGLLHAGERSVRALSEAGMAIIPAPKNWPARVWTNLNHPEDLQAFERDGR